MEIIPLERWQYCWKANCANSNSRLIPTAHSVHKHWGESPLKLGSLELQQLTTLNIVFWVTWGILVQVLQGSCPAAVRMGPPEQAPGGAGQQQDLQWHSSPCTQAGKGTGEHTWGKMDHREVWELHHWEWNPSPSQMEPNLFTSLGCDIHSVHLAGTEGESCQQIPWKDHSAPASISSFHVNQRAIQPGAEGIMDRKHQAGKCSTLFLINTND